jgi:uncharacterized damage-inducible protein DinB
MADNVGIIERVRTLPDRVAAEIEGLSEEELRWRPAEGAWSLKEVCGHTWDDSEVWRRRLGMMIAETDPVLPAYDQEALVRERAYQDADIAAVLGDIKRLRLEIVNLLSGLAPEGWERTGQHPDWGRLTIGQGMGMMVRHTEGHLEQVRELKEKATASWGSDKGSPDNAITGHAEMIERVKGLPARIAVEIDGLSEAELSWRAAQGGWSIREVCGHLRDIGDWWVHRLHVMQTEDDPVLPSFDQEAFVRDGRYQEVEIAAILGEMTRLRLEVVDILSGLAPDGWERTGRHETRGRITIRQAMEFVIQHDEGHLDQLRELKEKATVP